MSPNHIGTCVVCALMVAFWCGASTAQVQTKQQKACIKAMNESAVAVGQLQAVENLACLKKAAKGKLAGTAQACLTADGDGKVAKRDDKTLKIEAKKCVSPPDFAYTSGATVNGVAQEGRLRTFADLFGPDLDAGLITCDADKKACACQKIVATKTEKIVEAKWQTFLACKKHALADATSGADIERCMDDPGLPDSIAADSKDKIGKAVGTLSDKIGKKCDDEGVTGAAFADGACPALAGSALATCIDREAECRVCQAINDTDGLDVDCDLFDDGLANVSCDCSHQQLGSPNLQAAITKQITSITTPTTLTIELTTKTSLPYQLSATGLTFPDGFVLNSLQTTSCTKGADSYVCRHLAVLQATTACTGTGNYEMSLEYSCSHCPACSAPTTVDFSLTTEDFCAVVG